MKDKIDDENDFEQLDLEESSSYIHCTEKSILKGPERKRIYFKAKKYSHDSCFKRSKDIMNPLLVPCYVI